MRNTIRKKLLFVLHNYKTLKDVKTNGESSLVFLAYQRNKYECLGNIDIAKGIKVVEALLEYYRIQNRGLDKFIELSFFQCRKRYNIVYRLNISESTAGNWRRKILDHAEEIAAMMDFS